MVIFLHILKCFEHNIIMAHYERKLTAEVGFGLICWFYLILSAAEKGETRTTNHTASEIMFGLLGKIEGMLQPSQLIYGICGSWRKLEVTCAAGNRL